MAVDRATNTMARILQVGSILAFLLVGPALALDDDSKSTSIGDISLHVTNFGTIGHGFSLWPDMSSCEYPLGSGIEHLFDGGLWVGAVKDGEIRVTTGAVDVSYIEGALEGFEFTTTDEVDANHNGRLDPEEDLNGNGVFDVYQIVERSSLPASRFFDPDAVSHQDYTCDYTDSNTYVPQTGEEIPKHVPLDIIVHQESYAWSLSFADAFVILSYNITNVSKSTWEDVWVGLWTDTMVGNVNFTPPRGPDRSWNYRDDGDDFIDSLNIMYEYDYDGDYGNAESYAGVKFLGCTPSFYISQTGNSCFYRDSTNFNWWQFRNTQDPNFFMPSTELERYQKLSLGLNDYYPNWRNHPSSIGPNNRITLLSVGPFPEIPPDSTIQVVFAVVCGHKYGDDPMEADTWRSKRNLLTNARWAQIAYDGEDKNGNGLLEPEEDQNGNGRIDRYELPAAPSPPRMVAIPSDKKVTIYWDASIETEIDPVSGEVDFEGYRVYRARVTNRAGAPSFKESFILLGEFDLVDNIGYDTGLDLVRLPQDTVINGDTCSYRFASDNLLNGWQYAFAVSAFDTGDPVNNLESLESSVLLNYIRVFPGSTPQADLPVGVFPNPYRTDAIWDGRKQDGIRERERMIHFFNLPQRCTIRIYNVAGEVVESIEHNAATYDGSDITWYQSYAPEERLLPGGIHSWDLVTRHDQALATGLYLFTVEDHDSGGVQRGKFMVVK